MITNKIWYDNFKAYFMQSINYLASYDSWKEKPPESIIKNFQRETLARFIFESNNIEKEGLTFGETKQLVLYEFESNPKIKELERIKGLSQVIQHTDMPVDLRVLTRGNVNLATNQSAEENLETARVELIAKYGSHSREASTVVKHYIASLQADNFVLEDIDSKQNRYLYTLKEKFTEKDLIKEIDDLLIKYGLDPNVVPEPYNLLSEDNIRLLHKQIAEDLIDPTISPAGEYRNHPIMTDIESHYPAPEVVPQSMEKFVADYKRFSDAKLNPIALAAWASTMFVLIHPFSDFNGRLSRMIMNMIFRSNHIPFWISIRSNQKDKKRYFTALKHYRRSKKYSIATLISMQICDNFENFNAQLAIANNPQLPLLEYPSEFENFTNRELLEYKNPLDY